MLQPELLQASASRILGACSFGRCAGTHRALCDVRQGKAGVSHVDAKR